MTSKALLRATRPIRLCVSPINTNTLVKLSHYPIANTLERTSTGQTGQIGQKHAEKRFAQKECETPYTVGRLWMRILKPI